MTELNWKPAHELAAMVRKREVKPSELMELTIRRIEQTNPKINAFVELRADAAMDEARALDEKIARGEKVGALAGLPLGVKDLEDTVGLATATARSRSRTRCRSPTRSRSRGSRRPVRS